MDTRHLEPVAGPLSLNVSYGAWDSTVERAAQGLPATRDGIPDDEIQVGQGAINAYRARDPAEFELIIALRIRNRLPIIELPSQYSTVEAVTLFIAAAGAFALYSLLDGRSPIFQAKQEDFVPFKYIDRTNAGPDIQPYIDGLRPYAGMSLQILGPLLSLAISQGWLINAVHLANAALKNNNSTISTSRGEGSYGISGTAGELLVKIVRVWLRAD